MRAFFWFPHFRWLRFKRFWKMWHVTSCGTVCLYKRICWNAVFCEFRGSSNPAFMETMDLTSPLLPGSIFWVPFFQTQEHILYYIRCMYMSWYLSVYPSTYAISYVTYLSIDRSIDPLIHRSIHPSTTFLGFGYASIFLLIFVSWKHQS
jgi:hypothetical protein